MGHTQPLYMKNVSNFIFYIVVDDLQQASLTTTVCREKLY